jgi:hypothetical protein
MDLGLLIETFESESRNRLITNSIVRDNKFFLIEIEANNNEYSLTLDIYDP